MYLTDEPTLLGNYPMGNHTRDSAIGDKGNWSLRGSLVRQVAFRGYYYDRADY